MTTAVEPVRKTRVWALTAASSLGIASPGYIHHGLAAIGPVLIAAFALSKSTYGFVISMFSLIGAITSPVIGRLADRVGGVRLLRWAFYLGAGASVAMALSPVLAVLVAMAMLAGLTASAANPATNTLIGSHVPQRLQGLTVGIKQSGGPLGIALAGVAMPPIAAHWGWNWAVTTGATIPLIGLALLWWSGVRPGPVGARRDRSVPHPPLGLRIRLLTLNALAVGWGMGAILGFMSVYAAEEVGMAETTAGAMLAVIGFVGTGARLVWGGLADRVRGSRSLLAAMGVVGLFATAAMWLARDAGPWLLVTSAGVFGASVMAWNSVGMLAVIRESATERAGAASGIVVFGFLAGFTLGPWAFGAIVDASGGYGLSLIMVALAFALSIAVLAIPVPDEEHATDQEARA